MIKHYPSNNNLSGVYIIYKFSASNEVFGQRGLSHLAEHIICCSLDEYQEKFLENGLSFNAYTSNNEVVFHLTGIEKYLTKYFDLFLQKIIKPLIKEDDFNKEKKIVIQEVSGYYLDMQNRHAENYFRKYYNFYSPSGNITDLKNINFKDFFKFYEKSFSAPNEIILITKDKKLFSGNDYKTTDFVFPINTKKFEFDIIENKKDDKVNVLVEMNGLKLEKFENEFLSKIFSHGLSSPFYREIREKNHLTYSISTGNCSFLSKNILFTELKIEPDSKKIFENIIKDIFGSKKNEFFNKNWFETIKKMTKINYEANQNYLHMSINKFLEKDCLENNIEKLEFSSFKSKILDKLNPELFKISYSDEF